MIKFRFLQKFERAIGLAARGPMVAGLILAATALYLMPTAALAGPCAASSSVPCSPIADDDTSGAAEPSAKAAPITGRFVPDRAPPTAAADAAGAENEVGAAGGPVNAKAKKKSTFTFYGRNSSGQEIDFKFFSKTRNWVWPSATTHWILPPNRKQYYVKLICQNGEKVCFGAWWKSNPNHYWGVGYNGKQGCSACCYICKGGWSAVNFLR
jgi:hypothetical protein